VTHGTRIQKEEGGTETMGGKKKGNAAMAQQHVWNTRPHTSILKIHNAITAQACLWVA
jgi:hypothetical protein